MRVLLGWDGSSSCEAIVNHLSEWRWAAGDQVVAVTVQPLGGSEEPPSAPLLERLRRKLGDSGVIHRFEGGDPADRLLEICESEEVDLLVIGATGKNLITRFLVGSATEKILRHAPCSVLVARAPRHGLRHALIAVDTSDMAEEVLTQVEKIPLPPTTLTTMTTVLPSPESLAGASPFLWPSIARELREMLTTANEEAMSGLRSRCEAAQSRGRHYHPKLLHGDPAAAILAEAEEAGADLVVLGSHGSGDTGRFLLGSVSERVSRHSDASVLVVRRPEA